MMKGNRLKRQAQGKKKKGLLESTERREKGGE
jgi:hypothetical protein